MVVAAAVVVVVVLLLLVLVLLLCDNHKVHTSWCVRARASSRRELRSSSSKVRPTSSHTASFSCLSSLHGMALFPPGE